VNRSISITLGLSFAVAVALAACGDNAEAPAPLVYTNPTTGALRLVKSKDAHQRKMVLDLVVGDQPLTGYATGFDLPFDTTQVKLADFKPGTALPAGANPPAAQALTPTVGPLAGMLVVAQSQKAAGDGAVATDTALAPGTVLLTIELDLLDNAHAGVVFDGTAAGFKLPSGGLRDRAGNTVVDAANVAIGKLEVVEY
jgi:hypothetical protein